MPADACPEDARRLLLLATAMAPEVVWAGAHMLDHHGHGHDADSDRELAEVLVHGHEHPEGTPDHENSVLPSPAVRQDAPASAPVSEAALLESPARLRLATPAARRPQPAASPSPLHSADLIRAS